MYGCLCWILVEELLLILIYGKIIVGVRGCSRVIGYMFWRDSCEDSVKDRWLWLEIGSLEFGLLCYCNS